MRLYQHPISSNARRVLLTAAEIGAPLELVELSLMSDADRRRLAELNPNGKIPVLEDHGFLLWESHAIAQYLCAKLGAERLYPSALQARADVDRWLFWSAQHWQPAISVLVWERHWKGVVGAGGPDAHELARGTEEFTQFAKVLDGHVAGREWVSGGHLTIADLALAAPLMYIDKGQLPVAGYPNLLRWFAQVEKRPSWVETKVDL